MTDRRQRPCSSRTRPAQLLRSRGVRAGLVLILVALAAAAVMRGLPDEDAPARTARHLERAEALAGTGDLDAAVIEYKNALQLDPEHRETRWRLGQLYLAMDRPAEALKEIEKAQLLGLSGPELARGLLEAHLMRGDYDKVLALIWELKQRGVEPSAGLLAIEAEAQMGLGQSDEARASFDAALDRDREAVDAMLGLARLSLANGDLATAEDEIDRTLDTVPGHMAAQTLKGHLRSLRGDFEGAEAWFRKALAGKPRDTPARVGLIHALIGQNRLDAASAAVTELERNHEDALLTRYLRGRIAYLGRDWNAAKTVFLEVLGAAPNHAESLFLLGHILFSEDRLEQAEDHLTRFNALLPDHVEGAILLAAIQLKRGRLEQATEILSDLPEETAGDPRVLTTLGAAYLARGDDVRALELAASAHALAPDSFAVLDTYGWVLVKRDQAHQGARYLEKAAALAPDNPDIRYHYAAGLAKAGDKHKARTLLRELLQSTEAVFDERPAAERLLARLERSARYR